MKRRPIFYLLAGVMALTLAACRDGPRRGTDPTPTPEVRETPTPEPTPAPFQVREADVPPGEYEPWQEAYADFLRRQRQEEGELKNWVVTAPSDEIDGDLERWAAYNDSSDSYCLYDVDKDGIPELFIKYNSCEADYHTTCYTLREGEVVEAGMLFSGHSNLFTCPGENGVVKHKGHQGLADMTKYSMVNGALEYQEELFSEEIWGTDREYTEPRAVLPGTEYIQSYRTPTQWRPGDSPALLLPIYDYGAPPRQAEPCLEEAQVRAAIGGVLWEDMEFFGVSGDGFHGDTGLVTLEEYLQPGAAYPYRDDTLVAEKYAWADVNGDGQTDCILQVSGFYVVFSVEDDRVYGYFFGFTDGFGVDPDGSVYLRDGEYWSQVRFYKNQCYELYNAAPVEGCDLAWDPFVPPEPPNMEPVVYAADVPPGEYEPWREAYADFLVEELRRDAVKVETGTETEATSDRYGLYDVDEDGVPELFIQYGQYEIAHYTVCYTFQKGEVKALGDFSSVWGGVYTCPGEPAFLFWWSHTGHTEIFKIPVVDGKLGEWELLLEETPPFDDNGEGRAYTDLIKLVPGAERVPYHSTRASRDYGGRSYPLTLPVYDYGALPRLVETPREEAQVRAAIDGVLWEREAFCSNNGDGWGFTRGGDGILEEYLLDGYPYSDTPMTGKEYAWADANGDGQTDCILHLEGGGERSHIVFSLQGDEVYGYELHSVSAVGVDPDGTVYFRRDEGWYQMSFYKDQSYTFPALRDPVEGCGLAWDPFAPPEPTLDPAFTLPPGDYAPWQTAYMDFLTGLCEREAPLLQWIRESSIEEIQADPERAAAVNSRSDCYWLYDVDKDGVPELFIRYGEYYVPWLECYTYKEGAVTQIGEMSGNTKGSFFCTWPGKNAILDYWAWKGAFILWEYSIVDGKLVCMDEDGVASQFGGPGEPDPRDYVPGTVYIEPARVRSARPEAAPMLLPVCDYGGRAVRQVSREERSAAREAIRGALCREEPFYGVPGGRYYDGDTGWVTFGEYCREGTVERYEALVPKDAVWMDLDGDGAEECVVRFQDNNGTAVFHWQDGVVYAYYLGYYSCADGLTADGVFYWEEPLSQMDSWGHLLSFHQNQCYLISVPRPENPVPAAWEPFSP